MIAYRLKGYSPSEATSGEAYNWLEEEGLSKTAVAKEMTEELLEEEDMAREKATKGSC